MIDIHAHLWGNDPENSKQAILNAIESELGEPVNVVLTGGDAEMLAAAMLRVCKVEPLLTIQGIALGADACA